MAEFRFNESKSFAENCDAFLYAIKFDDPKMGAILRDNWNTLVAIVREGERDSKARGEFNSAIALALDSFAKPAKPKDGA